MRGHEKVMGRREFLKTGTAGAAGLLIGFHLKGSPQYTKLNSGYRLLSLVNLDYPIVDRKCYFYHSHETRFEECQPGISSCHIEDE